MKRGLATGTAPMQRHQGEFHGVGAGHSWCPEVKGERRQLAGANRVAQGDDLREATVNENPDARRRPSIVLLGQPAALAAIGDEKPRDGRRIGCRSLCDLARLHVHAMLAVHRLTIERGRGAWMLVVPAQLLHAIVNASEC